MIPTVLLHPIGLDRNTWQFVEWPNAAAIDLPGFGTSNPIREVSLEAVADEVCRQTEGLIHVVGLSLGGMVAQHIALRHPERVGSLVIACTSSATNEEALLERAQAVEAQGLEGVVDEYMERWFTTTALRMPGHVGVTYARSSLLAGDPAIIASYWRAMAAHDVSHRLERISAPTTVVAGTHDAASSLAGLREMAARIPAAQLIEIDGPHMLQLECPAEIVEALSAHRRFVEDHAGRNGRAAQ